MIGKQTIINARLTRTCRFFCLTLGTFCLISSQAMAASFTIVDGQELTTTQTLNANESGTIDSGGQLNTGGFGNSGISNSAGQNNITVLNNGTISTTGNSSQGIASSGSDNRITNNGTLRTAGDDALGIFIQGANTTFINNGAILTSGRNGGVDLGSSGIGTNAANTTIINNGTVSITFTGASDFNYAIYLSSSNSSIINTGTLSTSGASNAHGIEVIGNNNNINNSGTISTIGTASEGIDISNRNNNSIINSGTISTIGTNSHGVGLSSGSDNNSFNNSGTISTTGSGAHGIDATTGTTFTDITNSGTINVTGTSATGVNIVGSNDTLTNSGLIFAGGNATSAIVGGANTQTVNLQSGSQIIGSIDLGANNDVFNVLGLPLGSSQLTLTNVETITLAAGLPGVVNGNSITTVDPTGQSTQGVALSTLTNAFHGVISQRMAQTKALLPIQLASLELSPGMLFQERAPIVWGEVFGSHRKRGNDGLALAHTHDYKGFTGGYEQDYHKGRLGVFAGFADANVSTDVTSISTETDSFFGGVYAHAYLGSVNLTASIAVGVEDHDNERTVVDNLAGSETARSDFNSVFFSPSLTLSSAYTVNAYFELRPSATLNYNVAWYNSYKETGTTRSNLSIDDRTAQSVNGRLQLAVAMALNETSEFELRSGFTTRHTFDSDTNASLSGTSFNYASAGDDNVQGGFVGGHLRFNTTDKLDVVADVEYREASGDETDIAARLRFEYRF